MKKILFITIAVIALNNCFAQTVTINKDYILIGTKKIEKTLISVLISHSISAK